MRTESSKVGGPGGPVHHTESYAGFGRSCLVACLNGLPFLDGGTKPAARQENKLKSTPDGRGRGFLAGLSIVLVGLPAVRLLWLVREGNYYSHVAMHCWHGTLYTYIARADGA